MDHHIDTHQPDYGTGKKTLGIYLFGVVNCFILTFISFWAVMANRFTKWEIFSIIYLSACVQFIVQVLCFLRLNTQTEQGRMNTMSILFTLVILITIIIGSVWIMWNLNFNMMSM